MENIYALAPLGIARKHNGNAFSLNGVKRSVWGIFQHQICYELWIVKNSSLFCFDD